MLTSKRRGHARAAKRRRLDQPGGERRPRPFAMRQPEIEQRPKSEPLDRPAVPRFGGQMRDDAMVERGEVRCLQHGGRGRRAMTVEDHRDALHPGGEYGAGKVLLRPARQPSDA